MRRLNARALIERLAEPRFSGPRDPRGGTTVYQWRLTFFALGASIAAVAFDRPVLAGAFAAFALIGLWIDLVDLVGFVVDAVRRSRRGAP